MLSLQFENKVLGGLIRCVSTSIPLHRPFWLFFFLSFPLCSLFVFVLYFCWVCENQSACYGWWCFRHGKIFKTHILGCPSVMLACPEAARFVLVTHAHLFRPSYPRTKELLIGPAALFFHQGPYHLQVRKLVQSSLSLDVIRRLVPAIEAMAVSALESWCNGEAINTFLEMKKVSLWSNHGRI